MAVIDTRGAASNDTAIFTVLIREHREVAAMLAEIARQGAGASETFERMRLALLTHSRAEEEVFYPVLQAEELTHDVAIDAWQEHRVVAALLRELHEMSSRGDRWMAKFAVLKENVEHHVEEEEGEMFRQARQVLDHAEQVSLAERFLRAKDRALAAIQREDRASGPVGAT
jgi:hemerythrin superfamily protein